jgi:GntR family transcriptional regulator
MQLVMTSLRTARVSTLPLYSHIREALRVQILDGTYKAHDRLPSESELTEKFKASRITVRQALSDLQKEGLIFKIHGKGAFVSKPKAFQELGRLQGFAEAMHAHGYETYNRLISLRHVRPDKAVAERLGCNQRSAVTELKRVRFLNREPISLDVSYLPRDIGERLAKEDLATRDVFLILENDYGLSLGAAELKIEATTADEALAALLAIEEGSPILRIERLTRSVDGRPLDFEYLHYRGDAFQYRLRVERVPLGGISR